jgi:hypothetical protein
VAAVDQPLRHFSSAEPVVSAESLAFDDEPLDHVAAQRRRPSNPLPQNWQSR